MTRSLSRALLAAWLAGSLGLAAQNAAAQDRVEDDVGAPSAAAPAPIPPRPKLKGTSPRAPAVQMTPKHAAEQAPTHASESRVALVPFTNTPFPFEGKIPEQNVPFLDVDKDGRKGHTSPRGGVYFADKAYADKRVLLSVPHGFSLERPALIVLYLHGNQARLDRDVRDRQHVPQQVASSGLNAVLVAPQFAVDALDSSAGHFWEPGFLQKFLAEASDRLAAQMGDPRARDVFDAAPVVIVAYSGGYLPMAFALQWGGDQDRIKGVILLDGLYAEEPRVAEWVRRRHDAFFFSAFSASTQAANMRLEHLLVEGGAMPSTGLPDVLRPRSVGFLPVKGGVTHNDFISHAWTANPMRDILSRIPGYERSTSRAAPATVAQP